MDARALRKARKHAVAQRSAERDARGRNKKHISTFRKLRRKVGAALIETVAPWILKALARTWRVSTSGEAGRALMHSDESWIGVAWHGRMLTLMPLDAHTHRGISVLVSPSADGSLAKRALSKFGCKIVRGSLSKHGARAMREMHETLALGGQLVITPDGPRGPRHSVNVGPAWLARVSGVPIVSICVATDKAWRLKSWDRMTIPKPFARVHVHYGGPVQIEPDSSDTALEEVSASLRDDMIQAERDAFAALDTPDDLGEPLPRED